MQQKFFRWIIVLGILLTFVSESLAVNQTRVVVDMAGRKVTIPMNISKVYATSQIGIIAIYTLVPEKLAGWNFALGEAEKKFISPKYYNLPVLGSWSGKNTTANLEEIIRVHPDCLISMGTFDKASTDTANRIQQQLRIPVILVDGSLKNSAAAYHFLGQLLNCKTRATELGAYCQKTLSEVQRTVANIPSAKRLKVYYAEAPNGLATDPKGSMHTEVLDFIGGINVAKVPLQKGYGRSETSLEQLLVWNPDVIITGFDKEMNNSSLYKSILTSPEWANLKAVKTKRVYQIPAYPFDWFDRPPGVNRMIGVKWLAQLLYPQYVKLNIKTEIKNFYDIFYHCQLTEQDIYGLLNYAQ